MKSRKLVCTVALALCALPTASAMTTWYVNGVSGSNSNNCMTSTTACKTIGHAISLASSGDTIKVADAIYKENLTIGKSLTILGLAATTTIIDGRGVATVVTVSGSSTQVTLSNFTIRNGHANSGGGIYNAGALKIFDSALSGNFTSGLVGCGSRFCSASGGGIYNSGTLTIINSTLSGNAASITNCGRACSASGGGIYNGGTLAIINSTLSGNAASTANCGRACSASGGGIYNGGTLSIASSTLSGNKAESPLAALGGGVNNAGAATLQNSIVANNSGRNCSGTMTSEGYNLSSDGSCGFNGHGDLNNTNPHLGVLGNYGGFTQTISLTSESPAIDAGNPSGCTDGHGHLLKTDQRGAPRPDGEDKTGCDMGAYERHDTGHVGMGHCEVAGGSLNGECLGLRGEICMGAYDPADCPPGQPPTDQTEFCRRPVDGVLECIP